MAGEVYYQHSGKFSLGGILMGLLVGTLIGIPAAGVYGYLILYNPLVYINILASLGFGAVVGIAASGALRWRNVRNVWVTRLVTAVVGLIAFYMSWAVWIYALLRRADQDVSLLAIVLQPAVLLDLIQQVNAVGAWTIRGSTPTGLVLWIIWAIEALVILGCALVTAVGYQDEPFCESCEAWCKESEGVATVAAGDVNELRQRLESKDLSFLERLGAVSEDALSWFRLDLHHCLTCTMTQTLTVTSVTVKVDKKGKRSEDKKKVVNKLLLGASEADSIRRLGQKLVPPTPTPEPA